MNQAKIALVQWVIGVTSLCAPSSPHRIFDQEGNIKSVSCNPRIFTTRGCELKKQLQWHEIVSGKEVMRVPPSVNQGGRRKQPRGKVNF